MNRSTHLPKVCKRVGTLSERSGRLACLALSIITLISVRPANGDERLKGVACRSVHLSYGARERLAFYNEVTPTHSAPGTFFMVCGWNTGYFGLQELGNGKKLLIFSVWDNARGDDPNGVDEDVRVKLLHQDPDVRVGRFGGEGTGGQSFLDYEWKVGETYRCMVSARPTEKRTEYTGHFFHPEKNAWVKLITFSTVTGGQPMRGFYAFIEDFKRDRKSTENVRRAVFGNAWTRGADAEWNPLQSAVFTADANPVENIDAGAEQGRFFLVTGGDTRNQTTKLGAPIQIDTAKESPPADVVELFAR